MWMMLKKYPSDSEHLCRRCDDLVLPLGNFFIVIVHLSYWQDLDNNKRQTFPQ